MRGKAVVGQIFFWDLWWIMAFDWLSIIIIIISISRCVDGWRVFLGETKSGGLDMIGKPKCKAFNSTLNNHKHTKYRSRCDWLSCQTHGGWRKTEGVKLTDYLEESYAKLEKHFKEAASAHGILCCLPLILPLSPSHKSCSKQRSLGACVCKIIHFCKTAFLVPIASLGQSWINPWIWLK